MYILCAYNAMAEASVDSGQRHIIEFQSKTSFTKGSRVLKEKIILLSYYNRIHILLPLQQCTPY